MRIPLAPIIWMSVVGFLAEPAVVCAQSAAGPDRRHHLWGRCSPGAWKTVRIVTDIFDPQVPDHGRHVVQKKMVLTAIDDQKVTIEAQIAWESGWKRFTPPPRLWRIGFHGELFDPGWQLKEQQTTETVIDGRAYPCRMLLWELATRTNRTLTRVYYSDEVVPYVLRRHSVTTDMEGKVVQGETNYEVVSLKKPWNFLSQPSCGIETRTVQKTPQREILTQSIVLADVPGGEVWNHSDEKDLQGKTVRATTSEVLSYGYDSQDERSGPLRKRGARLRRLGEAAMELLPPGGIEIELDGRPATP